MVLSMIYSRAHQACFIPVPAKYGPPQYEYCTVIAIT